MIDAPAPFNRAMSWVNYLLDVRGELYWRVNAADRANTSWSNQWLAGGNGDGSLTYPGTPAQIGGTTFVPVASVRMKLIRDGLEDLEYMYLAEAKVGRAKVLKVVRSVVRAAYDFEHSAEPWLAARERLAALIEGHTATLSFNILDFGATPGGHVACTAALRAAVAAASAAGGGEVLVPAGLQFLTGAFSLASHVTLRLDGVLLASTDVHDYPAEGWDWDPALIDTHNATSTGIVGSGRIEGQAVPAWVDHYDALKGWIPRTWAGVHGCVGECRPKLVRFTDCSHVTIAGVEVLNAPDWSILLRRTSFAQLRRLRVHGDPRWPNGDALDVESGEHITIEDVDFSTGDDCIAISSGNTNPLRWPWPGAAGPVRHLSVRNATLSSRSSAIKLSAVHFGELADHGELTNLTFSNIRIVDSSRGLGFQQRSGSGVWHAIAFENVTIDATRYPTGSNWWGSGEPIWMTSVAQSADAPLTGTVRDITLQEHCGARREWRASLRRRRRPDERPRLRQRLDHRRRVRQHELLQGRAAHHADGLPRLPAAIGRCGGVVAHLRLRLRGQRQRHAPRRDRSLRRTGRRVLAASGRRRAVPPARQRLAADPRGADAAALRT